MPRWRLFSLWSIAQNIFSDPARAARWMMMMMMLLGTPSLDRKCWP
jgi:hypothetical protein